MVGGVRKDLKQAYRFLKNAAYKNPQYSYNAAVLSKEMGKDAMFYYYSRKADKANHHLADTLMGIAFKEGIGVEKNNKRAETYLKRAVSLNENSTSALFNLAEFYKENLGSYRLAYDLFKRAADLNHDKSCIELSKMYINGQDVKKDEAMAKHYFEKAVDVSSKDGRLLLAQMCIDGDALDKDLEYAEHLIFEAIKEDKTNDALLFYFEKLIKKLDNRNQVIF